MIAMKLLGGLLIGAMLAGSSAEALTEYDFLPVALKCPAENKGILDVWNARISGWFDRIRVQYEDGIPVVVFYDTAPPNGDHFNFKNEIDIRIASVTRTDLFHWYLDEVAPQMEICLGSEEDRRIYRETLKANQEALGLKSWPSGE